MSTAGRDARPTTSSVPKLLRRATTPVGRASVPARRAGTPAPLPVQFPNCSGGQLLQWDGPLCPSLSEIIRPPHFALRLLRDLRVLREHGSKPLGDRFLEMA